MKIIYKDIPDITDIMNMEIDDSGEIKENKYDESTDDVDIMDMEIDEAVFRVGDVVNTTDDPEKVYVISESICTTTGGFRSHRYEVCPIYNVDKGAIICEESSLIFQYHDSQWEDYFTEGTRIKNDLPAWRGELYNFYMFYESLRYHDHLQYEYMEDYNNDTIPPMFMEHILDGHSAYDSVTRVLSNDNLAQTIMKRMNLTSADLDKLEKSLKYKINIRNLSDFDSKTREEWRSSGKNFEFTGDERNLVAEVDKLDTEKDEDGNTQFTDHYPMDMTNLQIMRAIKEAYANARKTGRVKMQPTRDRRIVKKRNGPAPEPVQPVKGKREYEGVSKKGLIIRFWYNFDMNLIETAYPIRMNNNAKKH